MPLVQLPDFIFMKDLKSSIVESLDGGANPELFPFLPYLLQDLQEIGTDPVLAEKMIRRNITKHPLKVLDLGCGKGAVSIHLAKALGCNATGIDGMPDFIEAANKIADTQGVSHLCKFRQGDIRVEIRNCKSFDLVILGAINPVFGFIGQTLDAITPTLVPEGYVLIDDGFKEDNTMPDYNKVISRSEFYHQIAEKKFEIVEEKIIPAEDLAGSNRKIQGQIVKRANELMGMYPEKRHLFSNYVQAQEDEIETIENKLVVGMWLLRKLL